MKKRAKFSIFTHWISSLGETKAKTYLPFNLAVLLYCVFNLFFVSRIQWLFNTNLQSVISFILFGSYSLFLFLLLFYPQDKNFAIHRRLSDFLYISVLSGFLLLGFSLGKYENYLVVKILIDIAIVIGLLMGFAFFEISRKYGGIPIDLIEVRKKDKSFLRRNACIAEWLFFLLGFCSQLLLVF